MNRSVLEERILFFYVRRADQRFCLKTPSVVANAPEDGHNSLFYLGPRAPGRRSLPGVETKFRSSKNAPCLTPLPFFPN